MPVGRSCLPTLLASHLRTCVTGDIRAGREDAVDELMETLKKLMK